MSTTPRSATGSSQRRLNALRLLRPLFFVAITTATFAAIFGSSAEAKPPRTPPAKGPVVPRAPTGPRRPAKDGGVSSDGGTPSTPTREGREPRFEGDGGGAVSVSETKGDGGKSFRFEALEVEGRLKSPQIVYFLRRVRAEFAAGDLGHRSFSHELSETRNEPSF